MATCISFNYMCINKLCTHVRVNFETGAVYAEDFSEDPLMTAFGERPATMETILEFLKDRCFPSNRGNQKELLGLINVDTYTVLDILRKTHGTMYEDFFWIRFADEDINWSDVNPRKYLEERT